MRIRTGYVVEEHLEAIQEGDLILHEVELAQMLWYVTLGIDFAGISNLVVVTAHDRLEEPQLGCRGQEGAHVNKDNSQGAEEDGDVLPADMMACSQSIHGSRARKEGRRLVDSVFTASLYLGVFLRLAITHAGQRESLYHTHQGWVYRRGAPLRHQQEQGRG